MLRVIGNDQNLPRQEHAIASGTLPNGKPVIVNADGTVSVVAASSDSAGSSVVYSTGNAQLNRAAFDSSNNKVVFVYQDGANSSYGTVVIGTVSGNSISFGTPVVFASATTYYPSVAFDSSNNKIVVAAGEASGGEGYNAGRARVGTVSGTSISFGTGVVFNAANTVWTDTVYDSGNGKIVIIYKDQGNSNYGTSVVGTVSGTSISFGSEVVWQSANLSYPRLSYDTNAGKVVLVYRDNANSSYGTALVGTVSGTSISFGSEVVFHSGTTLWIDITYDSTAQKHVIVYNDSSDTYGKARVGTVSGTSISFGTEVTFESAESQYMSTTYDSNANKTVVMFKDGGNSNKGTAIIGTVSGTNISFGTPFIFADNESFNIDSTFDSNSNKVVTCFQNSNDTDNGTSSVINVGSPNLTSENYIGIANSGAADGAGAIIDTKGAIAEIPEVYYDLANASYDSVSFSVASQSSYTFDFSFADSGTKLYAQKQFNGGTIYQYTLSSAYDLSTASYANKSYSFANGESGFVITPDGSTLYISANTGDAVYRYTFGTAFDVSTLGSGTSMFSTSSVDTQPDKCKFNSNGTKFFLLGRNNKRIYEYAVSTAYDLSSASYSNNSLLLSGQAAAPLGFNFNSDGTKLFVSDNTTDTIFQYDLSTAYDITSASYSNISFSVAGQDATPSGIDFNSTGSKLFILGNSSNTVYQYNTETSLTPAQSYFVQNDGTLSETADDPSVFAGTAVSATKLIVKG